MNETQFEYLKNIIENKLHFSKSNLINAENGDGRLTSALSEENLIQYIKNYFENNNLSIQVQPSKVRHWYDLLFILEDGEKVPVNIKMTDGNTADNISSKQGMFYTLTGLWPDDVSGLNRWISFNEQLRDNYNFNTDADYYMIVFFKNTEQFLFTSLKRIQKLVPNGSNLPFQCKWTDNYIYSTRSPEEQCDYILNTFINSFLKKQSGLDILINWRKDITNG